MTQITLAIDVDDDSAAAAWRGICHLRQLAKSVEAGSDYLTVSVDGEVRSLVRQRDGAFAFVADLESAAAASPTLPAPPSEDTVEAVARYWADGLDPKTMFGVLANARKLDYLNDLDFYAQSVSEMVEDDFDGDAATFWKAVLP